MWLRSLEGFVLPVGKEIGACQKGADCKKPRVGLVLGGRAAGQVYLLRSFYSFKRIST